jgi:pre-mRNA-processing factor 40
LSPNYAHDPSPKNLKSDWQEYVVTDGDSKGKTYYYNTNTKKSCWEKPEEFMTKVEKADLTTDWREYSASDGRKFFYNKITHISQWHIPEEIKDARLRIVSEIIKQKKADHTIFSSLSFAFENELKWILKNKLVRRIHNTWTNRDEAREAYKIMLNELGVDWKSTWEQALKLIINDIRFNCAIKSICERKSAFVEWSKQKEKKEREKLREQQLRARKDFITLIEQSDVLKDITRYSKAEQILGKDLRWNALESWREREDEFRRHLYEKERKDNIEKQKQRHLKILALIEYLKTCEWLKPITEWRMA